MFSATLFLALLTPLPALAAFPGQNGKIAFSATNTSPTYPTDDIYSINPDGTGLVQLVNENGGTWENSYADYAPEWSPSGARLVFNSEYLEGGFPPLKAIDRIQADGSGRENVIIDGAWPTWSPAGDRLLFSYQEFGAIDETGDEEGWLYSADPETGDSTFFAFIGREARELSWSPDGHRIVYSHVCQPSCTTGDLRTLDAADGGAPPIPLTQTSYDERQPDWSPDGQRIVFASNADGDHDIYSMRNDGSGVVQLTNAFGFDSDPSWSPDGTKIAFRSTRTGTDRIFTMNADGSNETDLIAGRGPDWQPIPVNAYARPKSATPTEIALVPAYEQCTAPNRTHGPPLAFPSCAPPVRAAGQLTVGTPDANGRPPKSASKVVLRAMAGIPSTPADEADIRLSGTVNDVRLASDLSDYTGSLDARVTARITDKDNTPHPGGPGAATTQDIAYSFPIPCSATADTTIGGDCSFDTTAEAFVPGIAKEGRRAIWELGQLRIHDDAGNVFLRQGIFVP